MSLELTVANVRALKGKYDRFARATFRGEVLCVYSCWLGLLSLYGAS